jgi:hypothetical protein
MSEQVKVKSKALLADLTLPVMVCIASQAQYHEAHPRSLQRKLFAVFQKHFQL